MLAGDACLQSPTWKVGSGDLGVLVYIRLCLENSKIKALSQGMAQWVRAGVRNSSTHAGAWPCTCNLGTGLETGDHCVLVPSLANHSEFQDQ